MSCRVAGQVAFGVALEMNNEFQIVKFIAISIIGMLLTIEKPLFISQPKGVTMVRPELRHFCLHLLHLPALFSRRPFSILSPLCSIFGSFLGLSQCLFSLLSGLISIGLDLSQLRLNFVLDNLEGVRFGPGAFMIPDQS